MLSKANCEWEYWGLGGIELISRSCIQIFRNSESVGFFCQYIQIKSFGLVNHSLQRIQLHHIKGVYAQPLTFRWISE